MRDEGLAVEVRAALRGSGNVMNRSVVRIAVEADSEDGGTIFKRDVIFGWTRRGFGLLL